MIADSLTDWAGSCNKEGPITSSLLPSDLWAEIKETGSFTLSYNTIFY